MSALCPACSAEIDPYQAHGCEDKWTRPSLTSTPASANSRSSSYSSLGCCSPVGFCSPACPLATSGRSQSEREPRPMTSANVSLAAKSLPTVRDVQGTTGQLLAQVATPIAHPDSRGVVRETYRESWFPTIPPVKQLVQSVSGPKVLRGMHLHRKQWDVWRFTAGRAIVRLYDTATGDEARLQGDENVVIAIPPGISHGFYTLNGCTLVYALTNEYDGSDEYGWFPFDGLDPEMFDAFKDDYGWPTHHYGLTISERDLRAPRLYDFNEEQRLDALVRNVEG